MSENPDIPSGDWVVRAPADLGAALAYHRRRRGWSQEELAEQAAIHRTYLTSLELGHTTAQTERILRILRRLGVELVVRERDR